jgi:transcriptional regulator with XRE-family HTH domain
MTESDPLAGIGRALARLRMRAGFLTQTDASEALKIDKGQLSRWENENPRPTLENLGRVLAGYGSTMADLAAAMGVSGTAEEGEAGTEADSGVRQSQWFKEDEEHLRDLKKVIRHMEKRQLEAERRLARLEAFEKLENTLVRGPAGGKP